ncbi:hypothetical protein ICN48_07260 [Polynucleobacter sp. JS-Safj-400b-B2]|uniref:hypothetical protein n=1 Tax=Polynucleobacter sp. JS-Safj-400b-B2 TaxID=2576921 RepID=UPI001C0E0D94|nr:hypothetical protein [Polynucleobacter sp. JS-Safj-400b-B2]MBU3626030.1 hypothetical protein [Polynucleobacter sp. JS-Safj-400b-B2]
MKLTKELLRERMPITSQLVDRYRVVFGSSLKVIWAKEGDFEVGKIPDVHRICIPYDPNYKSDLKNSQVHP